MPVFITEASEENPRLLLITSPHQLGEKVENFFQHKGFEVVRVGLNEVSGIGPQNFYKICVIFDEDSFKNQQKEILKQLKQRSENTSIIIPVFTTISSNDPALSPWTTQSNEQQQFLEKLERDLPKANFFFIKDVVEFNPAPLQNIVQEVSGGELIDPQVVLRIQTLQDLWPMLEKHLLTPGEGRKTLFQGEKEESIKILRDLRQFYQQAKGTLLEVSPHPAILIPDLFVADKTQKTPKNYLGVALQKYVKQLRVEEKSVPLQEPLGEVQLSSPIITSHSLISPISTPYIENRLKKYEKRMEEVVRLRQFRPYWQRSQAQIYQLLTTKDQTKKITSSPPNSQ